MRLGCSESLSASRLLMIGSSGFLSAAGPRRTTRPFQAYLQPRRFSNTAISADASLRFSS